MPDSNTASLAQKRIFITGGASGLGKAIALKYAVKGYKVCIGDVNDKLIRFMEKSDVTAADVANNIFEAVHEQQFMVMPHKMVREQWKLKCDNPEAFAELMKVDGLKLAEKNQAKDA